MGQYWQIINIDKRQAMGVGGKLGEFFYSDELNDLAGLLAVFSKVSPEGWDRDRIMCIGDYLRAGDYPENVLTEEELKAENSKEDKEDPGWSQLGSSFRTVRVRGSYAVEDYETVQVLCNLTTLQYVRSDLLAAKFADYKGPHSWVKPSFGHVVLSRICWSSDSSASMSYEGEITRGRWAGHRFSIVDFPEKGLGERWTDVSEEVVSELRVIWASY